MASKAGGVPLPYEGPAQFVVDMGADDVVERGFRREAEFGRAACVEATVDAARICANARASGRVLFIFQLVPIQGVLTGMAAPEATA